MKRYATFFVIAAMSIGLVFLLVSRERSKHDAPAEVIEAKALADGGADAASDPSGSDGVVVATDAAAKPVEKPLRVTVLGWEFAAAGTVLEPPSAVAAISPIELSPELSLDAVEARLARGGADPLGADIALMPLPAFVSSYERLRALEPRAFLVVGFSRGREEVRSRAGGLLKPPPGADEVKLVALGPDTASDAMAQAAGSESATMLGLFALDLLAVAPSRVRFVAPGTADAKAAPYAALVRGASDERPRALSTVDASRLVPIVGVAPKSLIDRREAAVREWSKSWMSGLARAKGDVPGIARRLSAKEGLPLAAGVGGAPDALVLVERLGQADSAQLEQQSSLIGPLAKGAVTLETLTQRTWRLARAGGITAAAAPEPLPIDARIVSAIAPPPKDSSSTPPVEGDAGVTFGRVPAGAVPLVAYRAPEGEHDKVAEQIAFISGVFERAVFKVTAKGGEKAAKAIALASYDRGVSPSRLMTAPGEPQGAV
ncbi:MAG TPA: hypothetical protein VM580_22290, partial [Labilithrix sp.]|nr:hypothetical protein [Labilithrix sp.]